ncbi:hypothetical protein [Marivirga sp.]|uniref:hypothetical protein n=1 Tax=Marivirga sp. TaxID=2018662 RepID=UPI003DA731D4
MKKYIYLIATAFFLTLVACGGTESKQESEVSDVQKEEKIADEVVKSSEKVKTEAEETEKEVDELLKDI